MADQLRTSSEWEIALGYLILNPDGWDRTRLADSWAEFITEGEFRKRAALSTMTTDPEWGREGG